MSPSNFSSLKVHRIVEYIKSIGFVFETDELLTKGVQGILRDHYGVHTQLSEQEHLLLMDELYLLAQQSEMREAQVKAREVLPEDSGTVILRQPPEKGYEKATSYVVPYSYPVEGALRELRRP